jgi:hypothetical protein
MPCTTDVAFAEKFNLCNPHLGGQANLPLLGHVDFWSSLQCPRKSGGCNKPICGDQLFNSLLIFQPFSSLLSYPSAMKAPKNSPQTTPIIFSHLVGDDHIGN